MRIWDVNPGYLNRQSLLGEHRELHGIVSIISNNRKGYSRHPETLRWKGFGWGLRQRHRLLAAEMGLRGYVDRSPVLLRSNAYNWPSVFIDTPSAQFSILSDKYKSLEGGRIPLPKNAQQLWAQHKYSVMARDMSSYISIGRWVTSKRGARSVSDVSAELTELLRQPPDRKLLGNTLLHMWGYVSAYSAGNNAEVDAMPALRLLGKIQSLAMRNNVQYLSQSTALSELAAWGSGRT